MTRSPVRSAVATLLLVLSGCYPPAAPLSSGQVGCDPAAVTVTNDEMHFGSRTWTAICHDKTFYCSQVGAQVSCAPASEGAKEEKTPEPAEKPGERSVPRCCLEHTLPCAACPR